MNKYVKITQLVTIAGFMVVLLLPMFNLLLDFAPKIQEKENRSKAKMPDFDFGKLDKYTKDFDAYHTDNFSMRENFISIANKIDYKFFNVSPVPNTVIVGKEGWLYATKSKHNYKGVNLFTKSQLEIFRNDLVARNKWANTNNIKMYFAVVPSKMNMYPEYLPNNVIQVSDSTRYDQIVGLDGAEGINIIDIKKHLLKYKSGDNELYQRTDDHWNHLGAYYGYEAIMNRLLHDFDSLQKTPLSDFEISNLMRTGNMADIIGVSDELPEKMISLNNKTPLNAVNDIEKGYTVTKGLINNAEHEFVKYNAKGKGLKILVIRDSFTLFLMRFLSEHFKHSVYIHDEWLYRMREDILKEEQPDILLFVVLETELHKILKYPYIKTVDLFYDELKSKKKNPDFIKKARSQDISTEELCRKDALWIFDYNKKKGVRTRETLLYYKLLYEFREPYKSKAVKDAREKGMRLYESIERLAKETFNMSESSAESIYKELTTNPSKIELMKKRAFEDGVPVDKMTRLNVLWICNYLEKEGKLFKRTLNYYKYLYELKEPYKTKAIKLASAKNISIEEAINQLSEIALSK